jgi:hypothetical protein
MATEKKEVKPGFVLLHNPKLGLEKQVKSSNKKGLQAHDAAGYLKGPLPKKVEPIESKKGKEPTESKKGKGAATAETETTDEANLDEDAATA